MMALPRVSGSEVIKTLAQLGYTADRQRGSHVRMIKEGSESLTIPLHKELDRGTLRAIIRSAGLTVDEFNRCLR
ncbi:MAG: type II toxin-antitoxin system HicA family toxin [Nanoarchaeota archaeon]